jgi:hypothetical protein
MRLIALVPLLALAAVLMAAQCDNGSTSTSSGIEGSVTIGPVCPVVRIDTPCPDQPYAATIVIDDGQGREVTRTKSGDDGRFRLALAPGSYTLVPQSPNGSSMPHANSQQVDVRDGAYTHVDVQYDSGIR